MFETLLGDDHTMRAGLSPFIQRIRPGMRLCFSPRYALTQASSPEARLEVSTSVKKKAPKKKKIKAKKETNEAKQRKE
jgi:hypothetical protein